MDPNTALRNLREAIATYRRDEEAGCPEQDASAIIEAAEALDQWLSKGGFLPTDWAVNRG